MKNEELDINQWLEMKRKEAKKIDFNTPENNALIHNARLKYPYKITCYTLTTTIEISDVIVYNYTKNTNNFNQLISNDICSAIQDTFNDSLTDYQSSCIKDYINVKFIEICNSIISKNIVFDEYKRIKLIFMLNSRRKNLNNINLNSFYMDYVILENPIINS